MRKTFTIFYLVIMPLVTIFFLLGISSFVPRAKLFGARFPDVLIRIILTIWFCGLFIRLSRISKYSIYPNIKWSKSDVSSKEKFVYLGMGIFLGIGCAIITYWVVMTFLPEFEKIRTAIAVLNGVIIMYPLVTHYWVLKL